MQDEIRQRPSPYRGHQALAPVAETGTAKIDNNSRFCSWVICTTIGFLAGRIETRKTLEGKAMNSTWCDDPPRVSPRFGLRESQHGFPHYKEGSVIAWVSFNTAIRT